jgi:hypothetical protein
MCRRSANAARLKLSMIASQAVEQNAVALGVILYVAK